VNANDLAHKLTNRSSTVLSQSIRPSHARLLLISNGYEPACSFSIPQGNQYYDRTSTNSRKNNSASVINAAA